MTDDFERGLCSLGIDPKQARAGFRAAHPFVVAVLLAQRGFQVLPTNKKKIPKITGWQHKASAEAETIVRWQATLQPACWSIFTGRENGIDLLDIDGAQGRADFAQLESEYGELPKTWKVESGRAGGGTHLWFRAPPEADDLRTVAHVLGCAIDVRGWHGHAVLPGSKHRSGNRYRWADGCAPDECELAELPPAWRDALPKHIDSGVSRPLSPRGRVGTRIRIAHSSSHRIGDGEGYGGFNRAIYVRCCEFVGLFGVDRDATGLKEALRTAIMNAPRSPDRRPDEIARYTAEEYLDSQIESARAFVGANSK
jgi:hypothetical protein